MKRTYLFFTLLCCFSALAMDLDPDEESSPMNWDEFLQVVSYEAQQKVLITYNGKTQSHAQTNTCALKNIAHFSIPNALWHFGHTLTEENAGDLFQYKSTQSDPYILFVYLPFGIQKNILSFMGLASPAAQNNFFGMHTAKAFEYYAVCQYKESSLPIDLHFILGKKLLQKKIIITEEKPLGNSSIVKSCKKKVDDACKDACNEEIHNKKGKSLLQLF